MFNLELILVQLVLFLSIVNLIVIVLEYYKIENNQRRMIVLMMKMIKLIEKYLKL